MRHEAGANLILERRDYSRDIMKAAQAKRNDFGTTLLMIVAQ